ncbi:MAG TPA: hypothetical protein VHQ01_12695, partial [Pyrinomonadaceae bacterium]|nr:hypothetical protein [Pyrinomonadaceae bacterium]
MSVGMSQSFVPGAPGAPFGQSGIGERISACERIADENKMTATKKILICSKPLFLFEIQIRRQRGKN